MRLSNLRFVGLTLAMFSLLDIAIAAAAHYYSTVGIAGPAWNKDTQQLEGKVGYRFVARVSYSIGFSTTQEGSVDIETPYVTDPEYHLFVDEVPPDLSFDTQTGQLSGIPTTPGKWEVYPAVRCKQRGDNVYRGNGRWWTTYRNYSGKVWTAAKDPTVISISQ
jgi:hypothetical protein